MLALTTCHAFTHKPCYACTGAGVDASGESSIFQDGKDADNDYSRPDYLTKKIWARKLPPRMPPPSPVSPDPPVSPPSPPFRSTYLATDGATCAAGLEITSRSDCEAAIGLYGLAEVSDANLPKGCVGSWSYDSWSYGASSLWTGSFNNHATGSGTGTH